jgi:hypothetical protein
VAFLVAVPRDRYRIAFDRVGLGRAPLFVERRIDLDRRRQLAARRQPCRLLGIAARAGHPGAIDEVGESRQTRPPSRPDLLKDRQVPHAVLVH